MDIRKYWLDMMIGIAEPVLTALTDRELANKLPRNFNSPRESYRCLEAFGRNMCGIAPWLELEGISGEEEILQRKFRQLVREAIDSATDPHSSDFMNFNIGGQPLVDAAFLAHGIIRAPRELWFKLDDRVKSNLVSALKSSRVIKPCDNNWLLFGAMVEAALHLMGQKISEERVEAAIIKFSQEWYLGDGTYGDGVFYHFDYYNSFVIHPMYIDILRTFDNYADLLPTAIKRATRYSEILERMIGPDGTYTVTGRSVCYRFGAFQILSQAVLQGFLPEKVSPAQVRCALTAVINKCAEGGLFDNDGWLIPGVYGYQPDLAEEYINIGSFICVPLYFLLWDCLPMIRFGQIRMRNGQVRNCGPACHFRQITVTTDLQIFNKQSLLSGMYNFR